jgi:tripartite-type tricarboxylate transporter receptor subunit TctC
MGERANLSHGDASTRQLVLQTMGFGAAAVNVSYTGGPEAVVAVFAREVDFSCGNLTSLEGNVRYGGIPRVLPPATTEKFVAESFAAYSKLGRDLGIELK